MTLPGEYDPHTHARATDPDTSHEAAEKLSTMGKHCRYLLEAFQRQSVLPGYTGLTMEEAALYAAVDPWAASKRISDLRRMKMIEYVYDTMLPDGGGYTPRTRRGSSKRKQRVYDITQHGRNALRRLP